MRVGIMLCVNDHRNGAFTGRLSAFAVDIGGEQALLLECDRVRCNLREDGRLRLGRKRFRVARYTVWVGNWCWDHCWTTADEAARMVRHLRELHASCQEAWEPLFDAYERGLPITGAMLLGEEVWRWN